MSKVLSGNGMRVQRGIALTPPVQPKAASPPSPASADPLDHACHALRQFRKHPLLVLYYPPNSRVTEEDASDVYQAFRGNGVVIENKLPYLDVLIDSYGGNPVAAYRVAQVIRDFAKKVTFLVADHAYSAGTLMCFAADEVRLGHYAGLSPIDVTLISDSGSRPRQEIELASVDSFLDFATTSKEKVERMMQKLDHECQNTIDSDLMVQMVKEVGALKVGKFFRGRTLTGHYSEQLLVNYMFSGQLDAKERASKVITHFLFSAPTHEFHIDYHLCQRWGVSAVEMPTPESDMTKHIVAILDELAKDEHICPRYSSQNRMPFIRFFKAPKLATKAQTLAAKHKT